MKFNISSKAAYFLLIAVTFAVYYNSLNGQFVFDDESVVVNNSSIQTLSSIPKYFTNEEGFHKVIGRYYRPVVSTTYAIDYSLWGLDPFGFHITNVLIHIIAVMLLFRLLQLILLQIYPKAKTSNIVLASLGGALIFSVHAIHTEAVSWVSGRTDSLVTLFFFASFIYYIKHTKENNSIPVLSLLFYFLGLLSKEMIITLPVLFIMYDIIVLKYNTTDLKKSLAKYGYYAAATLLFIILRYFMLKNIPDRTNYFYFADIDVSIAMATMLKTIPVYFKLLFVPIDLLYHYNGVLPDAAGFFEPAVMLSFLFLILLLSLSVYLYRKGLSIYSYCIAFFLISLLPVMNIIPTMSLMAERFLYMPSFALSLAAAYFIFKAKRIEAAEAITGIIILVYAFLTIQRNTEWKDNDTLYSSAEDTEGTVLLVNSANILANSKRYDEASVMYRKALSIREKNVLAHHNLGLIHFLKGEIDSAEFRFKRGIEIDSLAPDGYFMLAQLYANKGNIPEAVKHLEKLQSIVPDYKQSAGMLAQLKAGNNQMQQRSHQGSLLEQRSYQYYTEGKYKEAIADLLELVKINPSQSSGYYNNIALSYLAMNDLVQAEENFKNSLEKDPRNMNALNGLADVNLKKKNYPMAISYYKKILEINPSDVFAKNRIDSLSKLY